MSKLLAKIHILKKNAGLDDDTYRDFLLDQTGKSSCKDLTEKQQFRVMKLLEGKVKEGETKVNLEEPRFRACFAIWHKLHSVKAIKNNGVAAMNAYLARIIPEYAKDQRFALLSEENQNKAVDTLQAWYNRVTE